ncbi:uncharacterized protein LOC34621151 [Cyclospora cayetanensis]|uniref:Uncharacterized protein LOC34621151 n=1 Tax=Cyclospora cayetanensis TaxID=88456 RepID=A0A6P6S5C5_9EIME|nr:uncharacterized protein LOC34621151 [Cyclospora cayetanensis]
MDRQRTAVREWTALFAVFVAGVVSTISLSCRRDTRSRGKQRRAGNRAEGASKRLQTEAACRQIAAFLRKGGERSASARLLSGKGEICFCAQCVLIAEDLLGHAQAQSSEAEAEAAAVVAATKHSLDEEILRRVDLRGVRRVFTIDPPSARDLDDAVHIHRVVHADGCPLATGLEEYEVGIHIADVSHFIAQDGEMDKEAKTRCATLLHPGGPKLTFSVIARFFADGTPNKRFCPYFFKSVIESCCRFSYDEVQELIDGNEIAEQQQPTVAPEIKGTASWGNTILRCSCCTGKTNRSKQQQQDEEQLQGTWEEHAAADTWGDSLKRSADADFDALPNSSPAHHEQQKQQQQRPQTQDSSPFEVHSAELRFSFDALQRPMGWELETVRHDLICSSHVTSAAADSTVGCRINTAQGEALMAITAEASWQHKSGGSCVACSQAHVCTTSLPGLQGLFVFPAIVDPRLIADSAVMRTHPPFKQDERLSSFIKSLKHLGVPLSFTSSAAARQTLQRIRQAHGEAAVVAVEAQLRAFLALAKYRTASSLGANEKCHFALDFMDYTHFTSPIRRYPDLMVHRCLAALINGDPKPPLTPEAVEEICNACNDVNKHMREADKACSLAMLNIYLCQRKELFPTIGIVLTLKKSSMAVFLPEIDAENVR